MTSLELANGGLLANCNLKTSKANIKVAKGGTSNYTIIGDVMLSLVGMKRDWIGRVIVYVKADSFLMVNVKMTNLMLVDDGINQTVATVI